MCAALQYMKAVPHMVVIDDLLNPQALANLRELCLSGTVWQPDPGQPWCLPSPPNNVFCADILGCPRTLCRRVLPVWLWQPCSVPTGVLPSGEFLALVVRCCCVTLLGCAFCWRWILQVEQLRVAMPRILGNLTLSEMWSYWVRAAWLVQLHLHMWAAHTMHC